jgi:hypothetical protein
MMKHYLPLLLLKMFIAEKITGGKTLNVGKLCFVGTPLIEEIRNSFYL